MGETVKAYVSRQQPKFYLLTIPTSEEGNNLLMDGILIQVLSNKSDRFKLIIFDSSGGVAYNEECIPGPGRNQTIARSMFSSFEVIQIAPLNAASILADIEAETPPTFFGLSGVMIFYYLFYIF